MSRTTLRTLVDKSVVGAIIGKSGETIKQLRVETNTIISILKDPLEFPIAEAVADRILTLSGEIDDLAEVIKRLSPVMKEAYLTAKNTENKHPDRYLIRLLIHRPAIGAIIGKAGANIQALHQNTGAIFSIDKNDMYKSTERVLSISGTLDNIAAAIRELIPQISNVDYDTTDRRNDYIPYVPRLAPRPQAETRESRFGIASDCVGYVIGTKGAQIQRIREATFCNVHVNEADPNFPHTRLVTVTGPIMYVQTAVKLIKQNIHKRKTYKAKDSKEETQE